MLYAKRGQLFSSGYVGAKAGESLEETLEVVNKWNMNQYGHPCTAGELYWAEFGWTWYHQRKEEEESIE